MPVKNPVPATLTLEELMNEFDSEVERLEEEKRQLDEEFTSGRAYMRMKFV